MSDFQSGIHTTTDGEFIHVLELQVRNLSSQLAQVTQERDEARAREAGLREAAVNILATDEPTRDCDGCSHEWATCPASSFFTGPSDAVAFPDPFCEEWRLAKERLSASLSTPSPAYDEWRRMRAVVEAALEVDEVNQTVPRFATVEHEPEVGANPFEDPNKRVKGVLLSKERWDALTTSITGPDKELRDALAAWKGART